MMMPRQNSTDERLDHFEQRVDERFDRVEADIKGLRGEIKELRGDIKEVSGDIREMQHTMTRSIIAICTVMTGGFVGIFGALIGANAF